MAKRYWIEDITIRRAPGFPERTFQPVKGLSPQLNVIWGPNGIGKTTLAKSMRSVLWERDKDGEFSVLALLKGQEGEWSLNLRHKKLVQTRLADNATAELVGRNDSMESSYWLSLHDLLQTETRNRNFHEILYNELHGGVDIKQATSEAGGILKFSNRRAGEVLAVNTANEKIISGEKRQKELEELERKIAEIGEELSKGEHFKDKVTEYERALEVVKSLGDEAALIQEIDTFDPRIEKVETISYDSFLDRQKDITERESELELLISEIEKLEIEFLEVGLTSEQIEEHALTNEIRERLRTLRDANQARQTSHEKLEKSKEGEAQWRKEHQWLTAQLPPEEKLKGVVELLKKLSQMYEPLRVRVAVAQELITQLGPQEEFVDEGEALGTLRQRVIDGIETASGEKRRTISPKRIVWSVLINLAVAGLSVFLSPWFSILSLLGLLPLLIFKRKELNSDFSKIKKALQMTSCQEPTTWDLKGLGELYLEVNRALAHNAKMKEESGRRRTAQGNYEKEQKEFEDWREEWREACVSLGIVEEHPPLEGAQFFHFSQHLLRWADLMNEVATNQGAYDTICELYDNALKELAETVGIESDSYRTVTAYAENFIERLKNGSLLKRDIEGKRREESRKRGDLEKKRKELNQFLESLGFSLYNVLYLQKLSEDKGGWNDLRSELKATQSRTQQLKDKYPTSFKIATTENKEAIEDEVAQWREKLEAREEKRVEQGKVEQEYDSLLKSSDLANAKKEHTLALEQLEKLREDQLIGRSVSLLAEYLEEQSQQASDLEILNKAKEWFKKITNRRYSVSINRDGFFARDLIGNENLTLDQLSDATRLQLLFAVRMGFIEQLELSGERTFPIFMDELLANSVDSRALTIIEAVKEIAKERQVFYFTAQKDEVEKFRIHAKEVFNEVDLEAVQMAEKAASSPLIESKPLVEPLSEPIADYYAYGKELSIAGALLWEDIEQLHLWHILLDSDELYSYLGRGYSQIGQLDSFQERIELLKKAQELARQGRPKNITLDDLQNIPVDLNYTAGYWRQIEELFSEDEIDGNSLVEALEDGTIKRLRTETKEDLIDYLTKEGFASQEEPLKPEEILSQILRSEELSPGSDDHKVVERYLSQVTSL